MPATDADVLLPCCCSDCAAMTSDPCRDAVHGWCTGDHAVSTSRLVFSVPVPLAQQCRSHSHTSSRSRCSHNHGHGLTIVVSGAVVLALLLVPVVVVPQALVVGFLGFL